MRRDTEDKAAWVQGSKADEDRFREICSFYHDLELVEGRMYDPDFLLVGSGNFGELKHRETPFHQAGRLFGIPPRFAFTYNVRDHARYRRDFPGVHIFVRCVWLKQDPRFQAEEFLDACGHGSFLYWDRLVKDAPVHHYGRREDDSVNKKRSYVLDIRNFPLLWFTGDRVYV